jgi:hypothetical protein
MHIHDEKPFFYIHNQLNDDCEEVSWTDLNHKTFSLWFSLMLLTLSIALLQFFTNAKKLLILPIFAEVFTNFYWNFYQFLPKFTEIVKNLPWLTVKIITCQLIYWQVA